MSSLQEGRQYGAPLRGSQESYRSYNDNARGEQDAHQGQSRRAAGNESTDAPNGQRRFLGSLPENAQLSQGSLPPPPEDPQAGREQDQVKTQALQKDRQHSNGGKSGKAQRVCKACGENLTGQFVRALDGTFHLDCFRCRDCGDIVASKFFPMDDGSGKGQYPLCETDYFRRLDLLCFSCGGALRGSYVTALDHKYHIDHFTCSVCPTAFGAKDSYYEHDGNVYCHYHYSTRFAQRCNGCQTAILKQFVEIFRNGSNQHWHPECYMIHKFWNVRLTSSSSRLEGQDESEENASEERRVEVRVEEEQMEDKTYRIWSVLSAFEETSAACISDMLLHVSNGAYMEGVLVAKKFIQHVDILFSATDRLDACMATHGMNGLSYGREAKLLCKRIVAFFTLLTKTQDTGVKRLGVTQELLSLVTGLAHYLKLLIRISLQGALKLEREKRSNEGLQIFLDDLGQLESIKETNVSLDETASLSDLADEQSDCCIQCQQPIDEECLKLGYRRCHPKHLQCNNCHRDVVDVPGFQNAIFLPSSQEAYCGDCSASFAHSYSDHVPIERTTRLQQYVYLLRVALARLLAVLRNGGILPHTSDDPNLSTYNSLEGHRVDSTGSGRPSHTSDSRSKSFAGSTTNEQNQNQSSYSETVGEMKRLRSTRMDKHLSTTMRQARRSRIIPDSSGPGQSNFRIEDEQDSAGHGRADLNIDKNALTLDDIPRIVAAEQIKEQRPNAYRHAQSKLLGTERPARYMSGHQRDMSGGQDGGASSGYPRERTKKYFSELTALEYFIVRHVAVLQMQPILEGHFNLEDLLSLIELRKQTFWGKFFKNEKQKSGKKKGVFGVALETLVERDGVDSEQGVGPGALRVPSLLDDAITAMRQMDMSIEGIFRKNGNIRKNKEMAEKLDAKEAEVDLTKENPVQVAALLKKFLRDMPDPLLTFKLYNLFSASQKIKDDNQRMRLMHLTCCLLPKPNRDALEVLFHFLNWAASFAEVDHESGSKMDSHNIATVMAPNILYQDPKAIGQLDESFLSIEAVHMLLENNDQLCEVPEDIQSVLSDTELFNNMPEVTTKEILKRYGDVAKQPERHFGSVKPEAADMPPIRDADHDASTNKNPRAGKPVPTRVNTDPHQFNAAQKESSVRHVQQNGGGGTAYAPPQNQHTPPQYQQGFEGRVSPYHQRGISYEGSREYGTPGRPQPNYGRPNIPAGDAN